MKVHIDRFDSTTHIAGKKRTYETVKEAALAAGRFSVFEATDGKKNQQWFTELLRDPDVEHVEMGYPWVGVRRRETK